MSHILHIWHLGRRASACDQLELGIDTQSLISLPVGLDYLSLDGSDRLSTALPTLHYRQIGKMLNAREPKIVNGPQILDKYVGESEANVRKLFADAEEEERRVRLLSLYDDTASVHMC